MVDTSCKCRRLQIPASGRSGVRHRRDWQEVVQEFQEPLGFQIFVAAPGDAEQQRLHIGLQQGSFVNEGGVEHRIGAVLIGEDVLFLAPADGGPHFDGGLSTVAPGPGVPFNAAEQPGRRWWGMRL